MQPGLWLVFSVKLAALWSSSALLQTPKSMIVLTNGAAKVFCEAKTLPKSTVIYWLRQRQGPTKEKRFEFLASWNPSKRTATYGEGVKKENTIMLSDITRYILNLTSVKLEDSGTYFCMMVGSPNLIFGTGTELSVVDVLPTTAPTTKKTTVKKKKQCPFPNPKAQKESSICHCLENKPYHQDCWVQNKLLHCNVQKPQWRCSLQGLTCGLITLSLLVASILVLLVSLSVAIHFHCLRRKARIRFMKHDLTMPFLKKLVMGP